MKGLILAGGMGTRFRPFSHTTPKQIVPIANKPILYYIVENLKNAGITDIGVIVGYTKKRIKKIMDCLGDGSKFGVRLTYIEQEAPLGLSHAIIAGKEFLGNDDFVVYLGDNMLKGGISKLVENFKNSDAEASLLLARSKHPEKFGNAIVEDGKIIDLEEKPLQPKTDLIITGVYMFKPSIYEYMYQIKPENLKEKEWGLTEAIKAMIDSKKHKITYSILKDWWDDAGDVEAFLRANRLVLQDIEHDIKGKLEEDVKITNNVKIGKNTIVKQGTILEGPVLIGEDCEIGPNAHIGPSVSIGNNVKITNTEIHDSVIMENCQIETDKKIGRSLIGKHIKIKKNTQTSHSFILGDNSEVRL